MSIEGDFSFVSFSNVDQMVHISEVNFGVNASFAEGMYRLGNLVGFALASVPTDPRSPRYPVPTFSSSGLYHSTA